MPFKYLRAPSKHARVSYLRARERERKHSFSIKLKMRAILFHMLALECGSFLTTKNTFAASNVIHSSAHTSQSRIEMPFIFIFLGTFELNFHSSQIIVDESTISFFFFVDFSFGFAMNFNWLRLIVLMTFK